MQPSRLLAGLLLAVMASSIREARAGSRDEAEWIVPKICVDSANRPLNVDPYPSCPKGTQLRTLAVGDPLPYRKMDQTGDQYKDIYPRLTPSGRLMIVASADWLDPTHESGASFKVWADGYDAYEIREGWVSASETRIGSGEYGTSFMAAGCKNYNGLIYFPSSIADPQHLNGSAKPASAGVPWEESNQAWPGDCPTHYVTDQIYTWSYLKNSPFGGIGEASPKNMDAILATMGLRTSKNKDIMTKWMAYGHLESFYFTSLYGLSRWERWEPRYQLENDARETAVKIQQRAFGVNGRCNPLGGVQTVEPFTAKDATTSSNIITMTYHGQPFVMTDCRDWTNIVVEKTPSQPPAWPVSALNLLKNFHFNRASDASLPDWNTAGSAYVESRVSTTRDDTTKDTPKPLAGVAYLRIDCSKGCDADQLYQEVPLVAPATRGQAYTIGVIGRTESGNGSLELSLSQLDDAGKVLSTTTYLAPLSNEQTSCDKNGAHCRKFTYNLEENSGSVILSSNFVNQTFPVKLDPNVHSLRFAITPKSANAFDLVSAWLMIAY